MIFTRPHVGLNDLSIRIGGRLLIEDASVHLPERGRVGLVGRNGTGKSTLLKAILGEVAVESGEIKHRSRARIGTVAQEAPLGRTNAAGSRPSGEYGAHSAFGRTRDDGGRQSGRRYP